MATAAKAAYGTLFKIGDGGGSEVFTTIAEVLNISGPGLKREVVDVTNMDSTEGWRERVPTLLDGGEISLDLNFLPETATQSFSGGLIRDLKDGTKRNFQLRFSNTGNTTWTIPAYVTAFEPSSKVDDRLMAKVTLVVSGKPTLA